MHEGKLTLIFMAVVISMVAYAAVNQPQEVRNDILGVTVIGTTTEISITFTEQHYYSIQIANNDYEDGDCTGTAYSLDLRDIEMPYTMTHDLSSIGIECQKAEVQIMDMTISFMEYWDWGDMQ